MKPVVSIAMREQLAALGHDPADLDRCLVCEQYAAIRAAHEAGTVLSLDEFETMLSRAGRIHGPELLLCARSLEVIANTTVTATVGPVWEVAEYPEGSIRRVDWLDLFRVAGFTVDGKPADRPAGPTILFRGSVHSRRRRMSWTSDRAQAQRFAEGLRGRQAGTVYQTVAPPEAILCINNGREEKEYVLNTRGLVIRQA